MKDGLRVTPGWAAIFVSLFLAALAAGAQGLRTSTENLTKLQSVESRMGGVESRTEKIEDKQDKQGEDIAYIRARIDVALGIPPRPTQ